MKAKNSLARNQVPWISLIIGILLVVTGWQAHAAKLDLSMPESPAAVTPTWIPTPTDTPTPTWTPTLTPTDTPTSTWTPTPTPTGTPTLTHTVTPTATPICPRDSHESNDDFEEATELLAENLIGGPPDGSPVEAFLCPEGDEDFYTANIPSPDTQISVQLYSLQADEVALELYDSLGSLVARSAPVEPDQRVILYDVRSVIGDYIIRVYNLSGAFSITSYTLTADLGAPQPPAPPSDLIREHIAPLEPVLAQYGLSTEDINYDRAMGYALDSELEQAVAPLLQFPANSLAELDNKIVAVFYNPMLLACEDIIDNGGFENDDPWFFGITPCSASYSTDRAHSGNRSIFLGIPSGSADRLCHSSAYQPVTIPADASSATLFFWYWPYSLDSIHYDWQEALILNTNLQVLETLMRTNSNAQTWLFDSFDMSAYAGRTVYVYYNAFNDGVGNLPTYMYVDDVSLEVCGSRVLVWPDIQEITEGSTTTVNLVIEDVRNLYGAEVQLRFDPSVLEVVDADPFIAGVQIQPGTFPDATQGYVAHNSVDIARGEIHYAVTLLNPAPPANGSGTLASITFRGKSQGASSLSITDVNLIDASSQPISVGAWGGFITVSAPGGQVQGRVLLEGRSDHSGASVHIGSQPAVLTVPDGRFTVSDVPAGTHTVTANKTGYLSAQRAGVSVSANSTTTLPDVTLKAGDANGDNIIDLFDLVIVGQAYGTTPPSDSRADINGDGTVNLFDLVAVASNYGLSGPTGWPSTVAASIADTTPNAERSVNARAEPGTPSEAQILVSPDPQQINPGDTTTVNLRVDDVGDLYGAEVRISFDPSNLQVVDSVPGEEGVQILPGHFPDAGRGFVARNDVDNMTGEILYVVTLLNPAPALSGEGILAHITFRNTGGDMSSVIIDRALLLDRDGKKINGPSGHVLYLPFILKGDASNDRVVASGSLHSASTSAHSRSSLAGYFPHLVGLGSKPNRIGRSEGQRPIRLADYPQQVDNTHLAVVEELMADTGQIFAIRIVLDQPTGVWWAQYLAVEHGVTIVIAQEPAEIRDGLPFVDTPLVRFTTGSRFICIRGDGLSICFRVPW